LTAWNEENKNDYGMRLSGGINNRTACWIILLMVLFFAGRRGLAEPVQLDDPLTPEGYIALLLVNEAAFPGERGYCSEEDSKKAMFSVLWVLHCRALLIPVGYEQKEIALVETSSVIDVMTAGGEKGQVDGFYQDSEGRPVAVKRVHDRVAYLTALANSGKAGRMSRLLLYARDLARQYVETVSDTFSGAAYTNNNGTTNWLGNWIESGDDLVVTTGSILVQTAGGTNALLFVDTNADNDFITRTNPLAVLPGRTYTNVTLSFSYKREQWDTNDTFFVQISTNDFTANTQVFSVPTNVATDAGYVSVTTNLNSLIRSNMGLRLLAGPNFAAGDRISFDFITFTNQGYDASTNWTRSFNNGTLVSVISNLTATPSNLLVNYTLPAGTSITIRIQGTLNVPLVSTQFINTATATNNQTPPGSSTVTNGSVANSVGDRVWFDADNDGIQDAGETNGLSGVTVRIYSAASNLLATTVSATNGAYSFSNLPTGTYFLEFVTPSNYLNAAQDQGGNDALDSDISTGNGRTANFTLSGGTNDTTRDAGYAQPPSTIGDYVWFDANTNGLQAGESGVTGVVVRLYNQSSVLLATTTSGVSGAYSFTNLPPGNYFLEFVPPTNRIFTLQDIGGDDTADSDVDPATGRTDLFYLPPGTTDNSRDAGLTPLVRGLRITKTSTPTTNLPAGAVITYTVTVQNTGTVSQAGVVIQDFLPTGVTYVANSALLSHTNSANLVLNPSFEAGGASPSNWVRASTATGSGVSVQSGTNAMRFTNTTSSLPTTQTITTQVGTNYILSVWINGSGITNGNIIFDTGDQYDNPGQGQFVVSTNSGWTQYSGRFTATNTSVTLRMFATTNFGGTAYFDTIVLSASAALPPPDMVTNLTLAAGESAVISFQATVDSGLSITQLVNTATTYGAAQPPISATATNRVQSADVGVGKAVTDAYPDAFEVIEYILTATNYGPNIATGVQVTDVLPSYVQFNSASNGTYNSGTGIWDIGTLAVGASTSLYINVSVRDSAIGLQVTNNIAITRRDLPDPNPTNDTNRVVILVSPAAIGNYTWVDTNGNGLQDGGEPALSNVVVTLFNAASNVVGVTTSTAAGAYSFSNLLPGNYFVSFTPPAGYLFATSNIGTNDLIDSDVLTGTNRTALITLTGGQTDNTVDAGFYLPATIGNFIWNDLNYDGQQGTGLETNGVSNVVVRLYNTNNIVVATTTSSVSGAYAFTNLPPGTYTVDFTPPAGFLFTTSNVGNDASDSDVLSGTNRTGNVILTSGQTDNTVDAGVYVPAILGDYTWVDTNGNGQQDGGDVALSNVVVTLFNSASNVVGVTTSTAAGAYSFTNIVPGN